MSGAGRLPTWFCRSWYECLTMSGAGRTWGRNGFAGGALVSVESRRESLDDLDIFHEGAYDAARKERPMRLLSGLLFAGAAAILFLGCGRI